MKWLRWIIIFILILGGTIQGGTGFNNNCYYKKETILYIPQVNKLLNREINDTVRIQYLNIYQFKSILGFYESGNRYRVVNRIGMRGKYQFSPFMIKTFAKVTPRVYLNSPIIQEVAMTNACKYYIEYIYRNKYDRYINKEIKGVTITMEGLMLGMHFCPLYMKRWLESNGKINDGDGDITMRDYMKRFENKGIVTTNEILQCNN